MNYVIYNCFGELKIGYMKICTCDKCKERGIAEIFIMSLDEEYIDCIKSNETESILYTSKSLNETIKAMQDIYEAYIVKVETQLRVQENLCEQLSLID